MINIGNNTRKFSTYSCRPKMKDELNFSCTDLFAILYNI